MLFSLFFNGHSWAGQQVRMLVLSLETQSGIESQFNLIQQIYVRICYVEGMHIIQSLFPRGMQSSISSNGTMKKCVVKFKLSKVQQEIIFCKDKWYHGRGGISNGS